MSEGREVRGGGEDTYERIYTHTQTCGNGCGGRLAAWNWTGRRGHGFGSPLAFGQLWHVFNMRQPESGVFANEGTAPSQRPLAPFDERRTAPRRLR